MATRINGSSNLLNSNIGLDQVLERPTTQSHLPKNATYVPVGNPNIRLENMYKKRSVDKRMMSKAKPNIDNPDEIFKKSGAELMKNGINFTISETPKAKVFMYKAIN